MPTFGLRRDGQDKVSCVVLKYCFDTHYDSQVVWCFHFGNLRQWVQIMVNGEACTCIYIVRRVRICRSKALRVVAVVKGAVHHVLRETHYLSTALKQ